MPKPSTSLKILLALAAIFYLIFILRTSFRIQGILYFTLVDDAMVSMRYAHHIAQGFGAVWNVGEKPVEGFTNPGWMLLMALFHVFAIPASKISLAVMTASASILLVNTYFVYRICEVLKPGTKYAPFLAATITAFYFPLVFWSLRGMEVGALALLVNIGALIALQITGEGQQRKIILISLIFFLALVVRMDSALQIMVICFYLVVKSKFDIRRLVLPLAVVVLTILAILWFQHIYFGDFLPNTYYQKVAGASNWERIKNGILVFYEYASRDVLLLALVSLAGVILYRDLQNWDISLMAGLFLVQCLYSVWVGGDYAEVEVNAANRFITQGMPALIILFSLIIGRVLTELLAARQPTTQPNRRAESIISAGIALGVLLIISGQPWISWTIDNSPLLKADIRRVKIGLNIAQYTSPSAIIAAHAAGQIPYYSDRRTIDLLGLNDPVIAKGPVTGPFYPGHDKWNYDYSIMQLRPDLIADNWVKLGDYMRDKKDYQELDNGMYIRKDSTLLDVKGLSASN